VITRDEGFEGCGFVWLGEQWKDAEMRGNPQNVDRRKPSRKHYIKW